MSETNKNYGIFRIEKIKLSDTGALYGRLKHAFREFHNTSFDPELTRQNECLLCSSAKEAISKYRERIDDIKKGGYRPPKNSVGCYEVVFTTTAGAISKDQENEFCKDCYTQLYRTFGKNNILAGAIHRDETTVHMHWFVTPIFMTTSILRRTVEEKKLGTCRTITRLQLNATHWTGSPILMNKLQNEMYEGIFKKYELERGEVLNTAERTVKKKNLRSSLYKKNISLEKDALELELKKSDFKKEMDDVSEKIMKDFEDKQECTFQDDEEFQQLPYPENNESSMHYRLRILPLYELVHEKIKSLINQVSRLKESLFKESKEKEKWYKVLFSKFKINIDGYDGDISGDEGLIKEHIREKKKVEFWENLNSDQLEDISHKYRKCEAENWKDYQSLKNGKNKNLTVNQHTNGY